MTTITIDQKILNSVKSDLKLHAKSLGIPSGAADIFIDKTLKTVSRNLKNKKIITTEDLTRAIAKELKKYHQDLAYVYEIYDKII